MSSPKTVLAILATVAVLAFVPMIESTDAVEHPSGPAEVYFFAGGECIAQVYVIPDSNVHPLPELPAGYTCWARNDTHEVVTSSTIFTEGSHIVIAFKGTPAPYPPDGNGGDIPAGTIIAWVVFGAIVIGIGAGLYIYRKRK